LVALLLVFVAGVIRQWTNRREIEEVSVYGERKFFEDRSRCEDFQIWKAAAMKVNSEKKSIQAMMKCG